MEKIEHIIKDPYNYAMKLTNGELVKVLKILDEHYYNTEEELVNDEIYDILTDVLKNKDPNNSFFKKTGTKIKEKVKLPYYAPSLNKIKSDTLELDKWLQKYDGPFLVSEKLDGVSAVIYKNDKGSIKMFSRGDANEGQDISHLLSYVIPSSVNNLPLNFCVRGELVIKNSDFVGIDRKIPRSAIAGLVNGKSLDKRMDIAKVTTFIAHSVINPEYKSIEQMKVLENYGFVVPNYKIEHKLSNEELSKYLKYRKQNSDYDCDGIVVVDGSKTYKNSIEKPKHAFAFKMVLTDDIFETQVIDVIWTTSRYGYIKPTVQLNPVIVNKVEIQFATAHNAKYINDNKIGPGAIVEIIRSGDVIPKITNVIKSANTPKMPDEQYKWNDTNVDIIAIEENTSQKVKRIAHFFKTLDIKGVGEGLVEKMVLAGYESIFDIIRAKKKLIDINGIGQKMVDKIFHNLKSKLSNIECHEIMAASSVFGRGFGCRLTKKILDNYPNIMNDNWSIDKMIKEICKLNGFDIITATRFSNNFPDFIEFYNELSSLINIHTIKIETITNNYTFKDQSIVFSGIRNKEWEKIIVQNGGKIGTSVSKNTSIVVFKDKSTGKYLKAIELGVKTMEYDEFAKLF